MMMIIFWLKKIGAVACLPVPGKSQAIQSVAGYRDALLPAIFSFQALELGMFLKKIIFSQLIRLN
jgi:hypothetical protein